MMGGCRRWVATREEKREKRDSPVADRAGGGRPEVGRRHREWVTGVRRRRREGCQRRRRLWVKRIM
ncbi:hypothetical protein TIFTF001_003338 [Ficus carica]|uniref:Uncharacterized protein n=1 Tax=Ficus carica TaxID=3494 RepID=A0AA87ZAU9_FICCA|nr:hypothetical protein TIFTF001_003338 [Ficus carica]